MSQIAIQRRNGGETPATILRRTTDPFSVLRDLFRWDPLREALPLLGSDAGIDLRYEPAFDIKETKDSFLFKADVPGVREQDLEVTLTGSRLTVSGKRESDREEKGDTYYSYERSQGSFMRSFTLPEEADVARLSAEMKDGVLTLAVPKKAAAVAKKIAVSPGDKPKS